MKTPEEIKPKRKTRKTNISVKIIKFYVHSIYYLIMLKLTLLNSIFIIILQI